MSAYPRTSWMTSSHSLNSGIQSLDSQSGCHSQRATTTPPPQPPRASPHGCHRPPGRQMGLLHCRLQQLLGQSFHGVLLLLWHQSVPGSVREPGRVSSDHLSDAVYGYLNIPAARRMHSAGLPENASCRLLPFSPSHLNSPRGKVPCTPRLLGMHGAAAPENTTPPGEILLSLSSSPGGR